MRVYLALAIATCPMTLHAQDLSAPGMFPDWHNGCESADDNKKMCLEVLQPAARKLLSRVWQRIAISERDHCVAQAEGIGKSYVDLEVCLENAIGNIAGGHDALQEYYRETGLPTEVPQ